MEKYDEVQLNFEMSLTRIKKKHKNGTVFDKLYKNRILSLSLNSDSRNGKYIAVHVANGMDSLGNRPYPRKFILNNNVKREYPYK